MPWCETCQAEVDEADLTAEGECPTCGEQLVGHRKIPWHLKAMIGITAVYLGWRAYQGIAWLVHHA
jgi:DNA-directed RNA polymerase subunit RPC12/RpoP